METKNLLSIGEVSKLLDVHIKSLRYYDDIGVLKPYYVNPNNHYRYYSYQQLSVLEAIKACIELDIPLKEFAKFTNSDGSKVNFSKILDYGRKKAIEKINLINDSLLNVEIIQREIEYGMQLPTNGQPIIRDVPKSYYFIKPFNGYVTSDNYYEKFLDLIQEANTWGYKTGFDMGKLFLYHGKSIEKFDFIQVIEPVHSKFILSVPSGERIEKCIIESKIERAEYEFPDLFLDDKEKIILESELISSTYNMEKPSLKLSCIQKQ